MTKNRKVVRCAAAQMLLHAAQSRSWTMSVDGGGDDYDYVGTDAKKAGEAVCAVCESTVRFADASGQYVGWAMLLPYLAPGETIADCGGRPDFMDLCETFSDAASR